MFYIKVISAYFSEIRIPTRIFFLLQKLSNGELEQKAKKEPIAKIKYGRISHTIRNSSSIMTWQALTYNTHLVLLGRL